MGLLDDAIREHLDLKRRRGADPTEIERAEREALGPVRRGPEPAADGELATADASLDQDAALPESLQEDWVPLQEDVAHDLEPPLEDHELPPYEPAQHYEHEEAPAAGPFDAEADPAPPPPHPADISPAPEPEPDLAPHPADPPPPPAPSHLEQETEEYELEEEEESDDVLESTPEFLQDAPDHDRLWFEQRPPRDFDFDG
ncbi:MAG TPA: hypothetical protein VMA96_13430 [Solirubrobacteraceae bacterium]|nr:hypothetical protein [Solirubrobacteraceae bacterium]